MQNEEFNLLKMNNRTWQHNGETYSIEYTDGRPDQVCIKGPLANNTKVCTITDLIVRIGRPQGKNLIRTVYSIDAEDSEGRKLKPQGLDANGKPLYNPEQPYDTKQPAQEGEVPSNYELYVQSLGKILMPLMANNAAEDQGITKPYTPQEINTIVAGIIQLANSLNL